ncbi:MAG: class I SAM-dependent rRNA methyltransferase [Alphaproteobacteria bacterium]|nr:class I SAM-dependent rRNA methyltransferase [Alphaproteobacteria bacterium]
MITAKHPRLRLKPGAHKRLATGHPWIYSNEVAMDAGAKALPPGGVVTIEDAVGNPLATAHFNPKPLISLRILEAKPDVAIDAAWFTQRLLQAQALRQRLIPDPFYRWVHAEGDHLPGLIVDRCRDVVVVQPNTAGMDRAMPEITVAIQSLMSPKAIILRGDSSYRALEGLGDVTNVMVGEVTSPVKITENGRIFFADPLGGQKTGWFFDQRDNRAFVAGLANDHKVLDLYTHTGGFAIACAANGAKSALGIDGSALALELATKAAAANNLSSICKFERADVFDFLDAASNRKDKFDVVVADPPAFVKSRKDLKPGLQGYRKLARLCAGITTKGGVLFIASCSHNAPLAEFTEAVARGITDAGRSGRILKTSGASADHPVHLQLPESAYLKALTIALD